MTSLGFPGLSSQSISGFCMFLSARKPRIGLGGLPWLFIPVRSGIFLPFYTQKTLKRTGVTSMGFPGLSPKSVSGFLGPFRPEKPQTDWDEKPGLPRLAIPVCFRVFWFFLAKKTPKQIGKTSLGFPVLSTQSIRVFLPFSARNGLW